MLSAGGPTLKNTFVSKKVLWLNYNEKAQRAVIFKVSSASAGRKGDEFRIQYVYPFAIAFFSTNPSRYSSQLFSSPFQFLCRCSDSNT